MSIAEIPAPTYIGPLSNGMAMTPEEFDAVMDRDKDVHYELKRNVLIVMPPPEVAERKLCSELGYWLMTYHDTNARGSHLIDTVYSHTVATSVSRYLADRVVWAELSEWRGGYDEVPAIVIDFISPNRVRRQRDYIEKRKEYAAAGVREYWIIDRFRRSMTVFCGTETEYVISEGETYTTELLPGFELVLSRLLEIADRVTP